MNEVPVGPLVLEHWWNGSFGTRARRDLKRQVAADGTYQLHVKVGPDERTFDYASEEDVNNALGLLLAEQKGGPWQRPGRATTPTGGPIVYRYDVTLVRRVYADGRAEPLEREGWELTDITYRLPMVGAETPADSARLLGERVRAGELDKVYVTGRHVPVPHLLPAGFIRCRVVEHPDAHS